jgi:hypothetical protein
MMVMWRRDAAISSQQVSIFFGNLLLYQSHLFSLCLIVYLIISDCLAIDFYGGMLQTTNGLAFSKSMAVGRTCCS